MKPIAFAGRSLDVIRAFPPRAKRAIGYELDKVQRGNSPQDWKAMPSLGAGVREIRIRFDGAWRVVYVANRTDAVYVLHVFQKKSQKTSTTDIAAIKAAYKELP